ncbi:MAG: hypothetical protein JWR16_1392 [Nevskia sp.]|nr:hypothetical protein [Nevskia sp.]
MTQNDDLKSLDDAWDDFMHKLNEARAAMKDPTYFTPPPADRTSAEGYRYMLGHLHRLIETELQQDADFPYIQHHPALLSKYTIDNADCSYLYAPIKPDVLYRVTAKAADFSHWNGGIRNPSAKRYAPNYVIFEAHTVAPGDSGGVQENLDGSKATIGKLDSLEIQVNADGSFEILIGPARPEGYTGNFIPTTAKKDSVVGRGDVLKHDMHASRLYIRELFGDWEKEAPLDELYIERIGAAGQYPKVRTAKDTAAQLRQLGLLVKNHMTYWTALYAQPLDPRLLSPQHKTGSLVPLPVNDLFKPRANTTKSGGGQSTNAMTAGLFELKDDQVLVIELAMAVQPDQLGFHLANYWGESYDFANHVTSLNHLQSYRSSDGVYRYVVSARDPGIQNWMDTMKYESGYLTVRFTYSTMPTAEQLPKVKTRLIHIDQLREFLPKDTPVFSKQDRIQQIRIRQRHVAQRYRQY